MSPELTILVILWLYGLARLRPLFREIGDAAEREMRGSEQ